MNDGDSIDARLRTLLTLEADEIAEQVLQHPELLDRRTDRRIEHWQSTEPPGSDAEHEIADLRAFLRHLAWQVRQVPYDEAQAAEDRYTASGRLADLDQALAIRRALLTDDAPYVSEDNFHGNRQGISRLLQRRYRVGGRIEDLQEAIAVATEGADLVEDPATRGALLGAVVSALGTRFAAFKAREDIDRVIKLLDEIAKLPASAEDRLVDKHNLGVAYADRYHTFGDPADLDRAHKLAEHVSANTPASSPNYWSRLNSWGSSLRVVGEARNDKSALKKAIDVFRQALGSPSAADRVLYAAGLAKSLDAADRAGIEVDDVDAAYREAVRLAVDVDLSVAVWAGKAWGRRAWDRRDWPVAAEAYGYLALAARRYLKAQHAEQHKELRLGQFGEVGERAAYALARAGRPDEAVLSFELSRAQLLAEAMAVSTDRTVAPAADDVVFDLDALRSHAAGRDIAYLVVTEMGGVALLVGTAGCRAVDLPMLTTEAVQAQVTEQIANAPASLGCRTWLWDAVMAPVLEAVPPPRTTLVLVPGGWLSLLPLHAASTSDPSQPTGQRYVIDEVAVTYTPSVRALRGHRPSGPPKGAHTLLVADPQPVDQPSLPMARPEAEGIRGLLPAATLLPGHQANRSAVLAALRSAESVHFACHARADLRTPLQGGLVLAKNEMLTVEMLRDARVTGGTAVLSACETAVPGLLLANEVVGLPSALLQAGVTTVIASQWPVRDASTAMLMIEMYRRLVHKSEPPAQALRGAQQWLRDRTDNEKAAAYRSADWLPPVVAEWLLVALQPGGHSHADPAVWAPFVHMGA